MSEGCAAHLETVRARCLEMGILGKLEDALDYLRTFSGGPESGWQSVIAIDIPFNPDKMNFICSVYRRLPNDEKKHYMTLGMIWHETDQDWSFHS